LPPSKAAVGQPSNFVSSPELEKTFIMADKKTINDLLHDEIKDLYSAESN